MTNKIDFEGFNIDTVDLNDPTKVAAAIQNCLDVLGAATARHKDLVLSNQRQQKLITALREKIFALSDQAKPNNDYAIVKTKLNLIMDATGSQLNRIEKLLIEIKEKDPVQIIVGGERQRDSKGRFIKKGD
jgi:hypothetical protein